MLPAVKFYDEPFFPTQEVHDVTAERLLANNFMSVN